MSADPKPPARQPRRLAPGRTLAAPTKPMRAFSAKRRKVYDESYLPARERFLRDHPACEMRIMVPRICTGEATTIQHLVQRSLDPSVKNLLDETYWMASCRECNGWVSDHSAEARVRGLEVAPMDRR